MFKKIPLRRVLTALIPIVFIIVGTIGVILYGRGYRPDFQNSELKPTGLLSATSDPKGSQVYIDDVLKTATDNTLNIEPGWYTIQIIKEGYIPWQKKLRVQGEVVTSTDAFLFPLNPSLSPLTYTGVEKPILSPDGTKLAYTIPLSGNNGTSPEKAGLWIYELVERPLGLNRDTRQVGVTTAAFNLSDAKITWSPDSTQIMADSSRSIRLYNVNRTNDFQDVTSRYQAVLTEWEEMRQTKETQKLAAFKKPLVDVLISSTKIVSFSPDETKILYEATQSATLPTIIDPPLIGTNSVEEVRAIEPDKLYVYDSREDKNYFVLDRNELPVPSTQPVASPKIGTNPAASASSYLISASNSQFSNIHWFPTSRHLVLTLEGKIDIMEYDRTNWVTVYSGPFVNGFIVPWPNGSRIIILTNLNPGLSNLPNLYTVNLR